MPKDGRSDGVVKAMGEVWHFWQFLKLLLVDDCKLVDLIAVSDGVYLYEGAEYRESLFDID